jgi:hypothetical protein
MTEARHTPPRLRAPARRVDCRCLRRTNSRHQGRRMTTGEGGRGTNPSSERHHHHHPTQPHEPLLVGWIAGGRTTNDGGRTMNGGDGDGRRRKTKDGRRGDDGDRGRPQRRHVTTTHNAPMAPRHVVNRGQGPNDDNESFGPVCKFCLFFFISYFY